MIINTIKYSKDLKELTKFILACRYLYYVSDFNAISDTQYDILEKKIEKLGGNINFVGSSNKNSYSNEVIAHANMVRYEVEELVEDLNY